MPISLPVSLPAYILMPCLMSRSQKTEAERYVHYFGTSKVCRNAQIYWVSFVSIPASGEKKREIPWGFSPYGCLLSAYSTPWEYLLCSKPFLASCTSNCHTDISGNVELSLGPSRFCWKCPLFQSSWLLHMKLRSPGFSWVRRVIASKHFTVCCIA